MSAKTYLLKKDLKTFIVKSTEKSLKKFKCFSPSPPRKGPYYPATGQKKGLSIVTKSLQSIKSKRISKDSKSKSPISTRALSSTKKHLLTSNLRYLGENFEEDEELNVLKTPSESIKSRGKNLEELINDEYQQYIEGACSISKIIRSDVHSNVVYLKRRKDQNALFESPLDLNCFWKDKKKFLRN